MDARLPPRCDGQRRAGPAAPCCIGGRNLTCSQLTQPDGQQARQCKATNRDSRVCAVGVRGKKTLPPKAAAPWQVPTGSARCRACSRWPAPPRTETTEPAGRRDSLCWFYNPCFLTFASPQPRHTTPLSWQAPKCPALAPFRTILLVLLFRSLCLDTPHLCLPSRALASPSPPTTTLVEPTAMPAAIAATRVSAQLKQDMAAAPARARAFAAAARPAHPAGCRCPAHGRRAVTVRGEHGCTLGALFLACCPAWAASRSNGCRPARQRQCPCKCYNLRALLLQRGLRRLSLLNARLYHPAPHYPYPPPIRAGRNLRPLLLMHSLSSICPSLSLPAAAGAEVATTNGTAAQVFESNGKQVGTPNQPLAWPAVLAPRLPCYAVSPARSGTRVFAAPERTPTARPACTLPSTLIWPHPFPLPSLLPPTIRLWWSPTAPSSLAPATAPPSPPPMCARPLRWST